MALYKKSLPHHVEGGVGRLKVDWPPVPSVAAYRQRAVEAWIGDHRNIRRPLTVTLPLLTAVCALRELNHPLPTRRAMAEAWECNIYSIDGAISTALAEGEITEEYRYEDGDVKRRGSMRRRRFLLPSAQLYEAYRTAERYGTPDVLKLVS